ncbi:UMP-CMP kinase 2-like isoform X8 [Typha latifolia]|uniref:UMP-CMP kinase 2-like isoform X8 n=1 Tax=Typha latifolia TaxID=4733 RepID=UPI003C2D6B59
MIPWRSWSWLIGKQCQAIGFSFSDNLLILEQAPLLFVSKQIQHALNLPALFTTETVKDAVTSIRRPFITFVLGGPGSGKGTQCARIASAFGVAHLSAGDLLREEISSKSTNGELIRSIIKEGKIVPSEITVNLIHKAIKSSTADKFLIDGFPRSEENRIAFERIGRIDDNIETIKKRLKVFEKLNLPVISYYSAKGKVHKISAKGSVDEIFEKVHQLFSSLKEANGFA